MVVAMVPNTHPSHICRNHVTPGAGQMGSACDMGSTILNRGGCMEMALPTITSDVHPNGNQDHMLLISNIMDACSIVNSSSATRSHHRLPKNLQDIHPF